MVRIIAVSALLAVAPFAAAHQPTLSDGTANSPETAIFFDDIQLSRVVYHEMTPEADQLWITFEITEPQSLRISLGLPLIDRLADYRPAFTVLGPSLPEIELPFEIPAGVGGLLFLSDDVTDPEVFDEPFSQTMSWILREEDVELPAAGRYCIVVYVPSGESGKLWIAPGAREDFSLSELLALGDVLKDVQAFHEVTATGAICGILPLAVAAMACSFVSLQRRRSRTGQG